VALRKVIAGWDGGERSRDALRFAAVVAAGSGAELVVVHAYHYETPQQSSAAATRLQHRAAAMAVLADADRALPYGARARMEAVECRTVVQGLHDFAESERADLIVLGATTKGALELHAVGTVAERLLRSAPCAVAVAPPGYAHEENPGLRVIGVAYDGSFEAVHALAVAAELAAASGAALKLIEVLEPLTTPVVGPASIYGAASLDATSQEAARLRLEEVASGLPAELRTQTVLVRGEAATQLIERAGILSLLVMGSRGYGPFRRALLGSVSAPVLRAAPCPVLVVPRMTEPIAPAADAAV
jgi:nucleotide-binding universal stress UspA family protein